MFQQMPYGSPLDPRRAINPLGIEPGQPMPALAQPAPQGALTQQLPKAPPQKRERINPFDREHIAKTLAQIGKGFAGARSFGEGLANAAGGVADYVLDERFAKPTSEIGGPDNAFEIITNPDGTRMFKRIEEVAGYLDDREARKNKPKPQDTATFLGDSLYAIEQLPEEQRPGAYTLMLQQAEQLGHKLDNLAPGEYSPTFSKAMIARNIGARQGSANDATRAFREEQGRRADRGLDIRERSTNSSIATRAASNARAERKAREAPPSTRKGKNDDLSYLR